MNNSFFLVIHLGIYTLGSAVSLCKVSDMEAEILYIVYPSLVALEPVLSHTAYSALLDLLSRSVGEGDRVMYSAT